MATRLLVLALATVAMAPAGCFAPRSQFNALKAQNAALTDRNRVQHAQIENLQAHCRKIEDQLIRAEQDLAMLQGQMAPGQTRLANSR